MYIQHCSTTTLYITQESCGPRASWWGRQALNISQPLVDDCSHDWLQHDWHHKGQKARAANQKTGGWKGLNDELCTLAADIKLTLVTCYFMEQNQKLWEALTGEKNKLCESLGFELKKKEVESQDESEYRPTHWFPPRVNQHKIWWCLNYS